MIYLMHQGARVKLDTKIKKLTRPQPLQPSHTLTLISKLQDQKPKDFDTGVGQTGGTLNFDIGRIDNSGSMSI